MITHLKCAPLIFIVAIRTFIVLSQLGSMLGCSLLGWRDVTLSKLFNLQGFFSVLSTSHQLVSHLFGFLFRWTFQRSVHLRRPLFISPSISISAFPIEFIFAWILLLLVNLLSIRFTHHRIPFLLIFPMVSSSSVSDSSFFHYFRFSVFPLNPSLSVSFILGWALAFFGGFTCLFPSLPLMTSSL